MQSMLAVSACLCCGYPKESVRLSAPGPGGKRTVRDDAMAVLCVGGGGRRRPLLPLLCRLIVYACSAQGLVCVRRVSEQGSKAPSFPSL